MPYSAPIKTPKGWILPKKAGGVHSSSKGRVVHFRSRSSAVRAAQHIMASEKGYKYTVNNKMKSFGTTDTQKKKVQINKKMSKKTTLYGGKRKNSRDPKYPGVLDTIVHEHYHAKHPKATEKTTYKKTKQLVKNMGRKQKQKMYNLVK